MKNDRWIKRDEINIWVTSLAKLLSGDLICEFLPWFKARYKLAVEEPNDFRLTKYNIFHTNMLRQEKARLEAEGWTVLVEVPLKLVYPNNIYVNGKVDLIGIKDGSNRGIIIDAKSGKPKSSDQTQLMVYSLLLGYSDERFKDMLFDCEVIYKDHGTVAFKREEITDEIENIFAGLVAKIGGDAVVATPGSWDCRYCDVCCSEKI